MPGGRANSLACSLPALAAYDIGQLMNDLARNKGGRAKFVEKKFLAVLDKPLVAPVFADDRVRAMVVASFAIALPADHAAEVEAL